MAAEQFKMAKGERHSKVAQQRKSWSDVMLHSLTYSLGERESVVERGRGVSKHWEVGEETRLQRKRGRAERKWRRTEELQTGGITCIGSSACTHTQHLSNASAQTESGGDQASSHRSRGHDWQRGRERERPLQRMYCFVSVCLSVWLSPSVCLSVLWRRVMLLASSVQVGFTWLGDLCEWLTHAGAKMFSDVCSFRQELCRRLLRVHHVRVFTEGRPRTPSGHTGIEQQSIDVNNTS